jgi:hypothetical protein
VDPLGLNTCPGGDGCKPPTGDENASNKTKVDHGEPIQPAPVASHEKTVRVRHYTNRAGSNGIEKDGVIIARDKDRVFVEPAKNKVLSPLDAQNKYQISRGKGRDYIEIDVPESRLEWIKNPRYNTMELTVKGSLIIKNPKFTRRK